MFAAASLARNDCILHVDDDLLIPRDTIEALHRHWLLNPRRCYGLHGRAGHAAYDMHNLHGAVEVILTRCLMTSREICSKALSHVHAVDDPTSIPRGNGEDIILSFTAMMYSGHLNLALPLPYTELDEDNDESTSGSTSVHRRWSNHIQHRSEILRRCRAYFGMPLGRSARALRGLSLKTFLRRSALRLACSLEPCLPSSGA